jgi:hypothetical protein
MPRVFTILFGQAGDEISARAIFLIVGAGMIYRQRADLFEAQVIGQKLFGN